VLEGGYDLKGGGARRPRTSPALMKALARRQPAIDREIRAGDEGRFVRQ